MQIKKGLPKKLKTINSLDTQTTLSDMGQSQIKISIKSPKEVKQKIEEQSRVQIIGIPQQDQTFRLSCENNKNLLKAPHVLPKKQNSLFNTHNFEAMLQSANEDSMKNMIRNTEVNHGSLSRVMNETSLLMILDQTIKQTKYKLQQHQKTSQINKKLKEHPPHINLISRQIPSEKYLEKQDHKKKLRRVNSDFQLEYQKQQTIKKQQYFYTQKTTQAYEQLDDKILETPTQEIFITDKKKILKKTSLKVPQPEIQRKNQRMQKKPNDSRLKLRDYIFRTQVSSAKALQQKNLRRNEKEKKQIAQRKILEKQAKKPISKYAMSNKKLCQILKEQINSELDEGISYMNTIKNLLKSAQTKSDTTNQDLAKIFSLRKVIKEEVSQKLGNLVLKLTQIQGSSKQWTANIAKDTEQMLHI